MSNRNGECLFENQVYFYLDQPIRIIKKFNQIHMAKVRYVETQEEVIIDIGIIKSEPSKETSISINWLRRSTK